MNKRDIFFAALCGLVVSWVAADFFKKYSLFFLFILPVGAVIGLWILDLISKKAPFTKQLGKFALAGAFADVFDIKTFQLLFLFIPLPLLVKSISFVVGTFIKYWFDKYWTFEKHETKDMHKEMARFFLVAIVGLLLNVVSFYCFAKINLSMSRHLRMELSIIFAAITSGLWNFLGYKFLVFKK